MISKIIANPIALSIITGIIVFIVTWPINNWLNNRGNKKEYYIRLEEANEQIIKLCTDYLIMSKCIENEVIEKIIYASIIEFKVQAEDIYKLDSVKALLVKVFINLRLIEDDIKKDIVNSLCKHEENKSRNRNDYFSSEKTNEINSFYYQNKRDLLTTMMTMLVAMTSIIIVLIYSVNNNINLNLIDFSIFKLIEKLDLNYFFIITIIIIIIIILEISMLTFMRTSRNMRDEKIIRINNERKKHKKMEEENESK